MSFIKLQNVTYKYNNSLSPAVNYVSFNIDHNEQVLLTGGNGSGKSTLVKLIMKEIELQNGRLQIGGRDIKKIKLNEYSRRIGYVPQEPAKMFFNQTVFDEVAFSLKINKKTIGEIDKKVNKYLDIFNISSLRDKLPYKLSEGQKQLVALCSVLVMDIDFIILDEPTTGLDKVNKGKLIEELKRQSDKGRGVIMVSHDNHLIDDFGGREIHMMKGRAVEVLQFTNL